MFLVSMFTSWRVSLCSLSQFSNSAKVSSVFCASVFPYLQFSLCSVSQYSTSFRFPLCSVFQCSSILWLIFSFLLCSNITTIKFLPLRGTFSFKSWHPYYICFSVGVLLKFKSFLAMFFSPAFFILTFASLRVFLLSPLLHLFFVPHSYVP
jgi:hypothetical protein